MEDLKCREVKTGFCRKRYIQTGYSDSHWLEIWKNHLCPSIGPNGGSVAMYSVLLRGGGGGGRANSDAASYKISRICVFIEASMNLKSNFLNK
jgi:hypothetical protein